MSSSNNEAIGFGLRSSDISVETLLRLAVERGDKEMVESLVKKVKIIDSRGQQVLMDLRDQCGNTILHTAVAKNRKKVAAFLLRIGMNPNLDNAEGLTPLHIICQGSRDDYVLVKQIFEQSNNIYHPLLVNTRDKFGNAPLHSALESGHKRIVALLLKNGANPNLPNNLGYTPLHIICRNYRDNGLAKLFFDLNDGQKASVNINARDKQAATPIHWALIQSHKNIVSLLLTKGASLHLPDEMGLLPLHSICTISSNDDLLMFLFNIIDEKDRQKMINIQNKNGKTPLHCALEYNVKEAAAFLIRKGASPYLPDEKGLTPLHVMSRESQFIDLLKNLFEIGKRKRRSVKINAKDKLGNTSLHLAMESRNNAAVELLLKKGADPNSANADMSTPLHIMCKNCRHDSDLENMFFKISDEKRWLLHINATDKLGYTPLNLALEYHNTKATELLLKRGGTQNSLDKKGLICRPICENSNNDDFTKKSFETSNREDRLVKFNAQYKSGNESLPIVEKMIRKCAISKWFSEISWSYVILYIVFLLLCCLAFQYMGIGKMDYEDIAQQSIALCRIRAARKIFIENLS